MVIDCLPGEQNMSFAQTTLNDLAFVINHINRENGWNVIRPEEWKKGEELSQEAVYHLGTIIALIHSEVSEALEAVRHNDRDNFNEELADIIIRVLDCAGGLGIDIDGEIQKKLEKNRNRAYKHGGKKV